MRIGPVLLTVSVTLFVIGLKSYAGAFEGVLRPQVDRGCEGESTRPLKGWTSYGTMGPSCLAANQGDALRASLMYPDFIIDAKKIKISHQDGRDVINDEGHQHISQYAVNVLNLIDEMAAKFARQRAVIERDIRKKPLAPDELNSFVLFSEIVGYQESLFSQYQREDNGNDNLNRLRITVGDPLFLRDDNGDVIQKDGKPEQAKDHLGNPIYRAKGMFQILASLNSPLAKNNFDLVLNIENGLEYLYRNWSLIMGYSKMEKWLATDFASCRNLIFTPHGVNYLNVLRAAYGMYNGGDEKICRFAVSDKAYAKYRKENPMCDVGQVSFADDAEKQRCESRQKNGYFAYPWVNDVRIRQLANDLRWEKSLGVKREERTRAREQNPNWLSFDLDCARRNGRFCLRATDDKSRLKALLANNLEGKLYTLNTDDSSVGDEGSFCAFNPAKQNFTCTHQERWVPCLRTGNKFPLEKTEANHKVLSAYFTLHTLPLDENDPLIHFVDDPRQLCKQNDDGVFVTGTYVQALQNLLVRKEASPQSPALTTLKQNAIVQILDFDLHPRQGLERWYKVELQNKQGKVTDGYIFGGDDLTWNKYIAPYTHTAPLASAVIPLVGSQIQLSNNALCTVKDIAISGVDQVLTAQVADGANNLSWVRLGQLHTNSGTIGNSFNQQFNIVSPSSGVQP